MIKIDENALICDLAETYHIYNYRQLPADLVAVFSVGLRENARIKMAMSDQRVSLETLLLASIADRVGILAWQNTEDGHKGRNAPKEFVSILTEEPKEREESVFKSGEDFENARARILKDLEVNNGN
ncbi:hypothetical protein Si133o_01218 [Streptococcus infantarius subsp. infantarius]|uniref:Phage protein n=2 Tax=Streptococcus infantarius TaxID=102684 RepID=A0A380KLP4_9STRE|nr:DUF5361 domain-containing protein [Streptococcus infantarius]EDT47252.1 hypothetical protein STRINF_01553 [Streptococcus infantarius subsp. infantarius ATCC BAA-102]MCO4467219.1 hypothetical protein [Streptococcus infantarius subsp. infantarius]QQB29654.1 DUF5361 domain-containing protein [Streptococcus infantarius]SUN68094.1 phage protein [Streptococcus infantarius]